MSRHRLSFTERRRACLALKFARLDRRETRNTITEPISFTGLSISALRGLAQLGIMSADDGDSGLLALNLMAQQAKQNQSGRRQFAIKPHPSAALAPEWPAKHSAHTAGGGSAQAPATAPSADTTSQPVNGSITSGPADSAASQANGISLPWRPASRAGGGPRWRRAEDRATGRRRPQSRW